MPDLDTNPGGAIASRTTALPDLLGVSPADLLAADIERPLATVDEARARAAEIKAGAATYVAVTRRIADAYACRDWVPLGYATWHEYRDQEFGEVFARAHATERRAAVADLRRQGLSIPQISAIVRASVGTVHADIARLSATESLPAEIQGSDGKTYAATRPTPPPARDPAPNTGTPAAIATTGPAGSTTTTGVTPDPTDQVWMATARRGIEAHAPRNITFTRCDRPLRTGITMPAGSATSRYAVTWCPRCWPAEPVAADGECDRCGADALGDQLGDVDGERHCPPCRTTPPAGYMATMLPHAGLLPGDYIEVRPGPNTTTVGYDMVTRVELPPTAGRTQSLNMLLTTPGQPTPYERLAVAEVRVYREAGRTEASGGVTGCAVCRAQVPVAVTYNDRCPSCMDERDHSQMLNEGLSAQHPSMVPGPERELPAAQVRTGDLVWVSWRTGTGGGTGWQPVTSWEIAPEPDVPGDWTVEAQTTDTATLRWEWPWDQTLRVRRPVPGTAEPAVLTEPDPDRPAVVDAAAVVPSAELAPPTQLTVDEIRRLRYAFRWARAHGWTHRHDANGRGWPGDLGRDYTPGDAPLRPGRDGEQVDRIDVSWDGPEVTIEVRGGDYYLYEIILRVTGVDQALDLLCAHGLLPVEQSSAYQAGIQACALRGHPADGIRP